MSTLNAYRARVGLLLDGEQFVSSTSTSGTATTLVDTSRLKNAYWGATMFGGSWLLLVAETGTDRERLIDSYAPSTGTLTFSQSVSPDVGTVAYEVYSVRPSYIETKINEALERVFTLESVTVAPAADGDRQISLSSLTWFTRPDEQFIGLYEQVGTTSNQYVFRKVPNVRVRRDRDAFTLNLMGPTYKTTDTLHFLAWEPYSAIATMASPTDSSTAPLDWVAWETVREITERQLVNVATEESAALGRLLALATKRCAEMKADYMPRDQARQTLWASEDFRFGPLGLGTGRVW